MRISLSQIKAGSKCLKYLSFLSDSRLPLEDNDTHICRDVITKAYRKAMEDGWKVEWKKIVGWVDSRVFHDVDITKEKEFEEAKSRAERLLLFLQNWYDSYVDEQVGAYINIPLEGAIGRSTIHGVAPIVLLGPTPSILIVDQIARPVTELYNDIEIRGLQWLLSEALETDEIEVRYRDIGQKGGHKETRSYAGKKDHERAKETIGYIAGLIELGITYPSVTQMCNTCPFKLRCKL